MLPEKHHLEKENLYGRLLHICHYFLVDRWKRFIVLQTITAAKINNCTLVICLQNQINQLVLLNNLIIIFL
jgi:hypothetical protein